MFSHRHNKNDAFLKDNLVDFAIVREPMYKYSRTAQDKYFDYPTFAFLFAWFSKSPDARSFSDSKFAENNEPRYPQRMFQEIALLGSEALKHLKKSASVLDSKMPGAQRDGVLTAQTKLHLAKHLDKYLAVRRDQWANDKK